MAYLRLLMPGLSAVPLAAHLYRAGELALAGASLALLVAIVLAVAAFTAAALIFRKGRLRVRDDIGGRF